MARIFHLNMCRFGGGHPRRNAAFRQAFIDIRLAGRQDFIVAGFTEVMTSTPNLFTTLSGMAQALDPGLTRLMVIEVGTTALGMQEYIGIAWDPGYVTMQHAGCVLRDPVTMRWTAHNVRAAAILNPRLRLRANAPATADARGLAYIAATYIGRNIIFGFMHNMYRLGSRYVAYTSLSDMAESARQAAGGAYRTAEVIIGGDFNLRPRRPRPPRGNALALHERAAMNNNVYVNTTRANPYDYWVVSNPNITHARARVHQRSLRPGLSDHAAIALTYF